MDNCIVTDARTLDGRKIDIEIRNGQIATIADAGDGDPTAFDEDQHYSVDGRLVTSGLSEPHVHLDTTHTAGEPEWNRSGTLHEGISIWANRKQSITENGVKKRAARTLDWLVAHGVTQARVHVDVTEPTLTAPKALLSLRKEYAHLIDLEFIAFPQDGIIGNDENEALLREALELGIDGVGGIPHNEGTREDGVESIDRQASLANKFDGPLDLHVDETDDPGSRFTEVLARKAIEYGIGGRTTASHATAMHSYPDAYVDRLLPLLTESGISVVTNPAVNAILQGRNEAYPRRRGHTRIDNLLDAGITVAVGHDSVMDPWYHYGIGDPIDMLYVLIHYAHMNGYDDVSTLWEMLTSFNAAVMEMDTPTLKPGAPGSLVVFDASNPFTALRTRAPRKLVLKDGRRVASTTPSTTRVHDNDGSRKLTFDRTD